MNTHARLSPSGADRWMICPGSIAMTANLPDDDNENSALGTAKHWVAAACLEGGLHPAEFLAHKLMVHKGACYDLKLSKPEVKPGEVSFTFEVDADFVAAVSTYVHAVRKYAEGGQAWFEVKVPIGQLTGEQGATGTADALILTPDGELQGHDAKFGWKEVSPINNKQAMIYLSGGLYQLPPEAAAKVKRFRVVIHQPAHGPAQEWDFGFDEMNIFEQEVINQASVSHIASACADTWLGKPDRLEYLKVSEKGCLFCKAKPTCPAVDKLIVDTVGASFEELAAPCNSTPNAQVEYFKSLLPSDRTLTRDALGDPVEWVPVFTEIGEKFASLDIIESWCKAVRGKVESLLIEHENAPEVTAALGAKVVDGKKGNRAWANEAEAEKTFKAMRLKQGQMYKFTLISPTVAEKLLGDQPKRWAKVTPLITQEPGKPSVAPLDDKRPAKEFPKVIEAFDVIDGDTGAQYV